MEATRHLKLKDMAINELLNLGYTTDEIKTEYVIYIDNKMYIVDVVGINDILGKTAIECGDLNSDNRCSILLKHFDKLIHLPYLFVTKRSKEKIMVVNVTKEQYSRLNKLLVDGHYKHRSEFLRHILEIGLDGLEKKHN